MGWHWPGYLPTFGHLGAIDLLEHGVSEADAVSYLPSGSNRLDPCTMLYLAQHPAHGKL